MTTTEPAAVTALAAIYNRRATRCFTSTNVDETTVRELLRAAVHAPTAMHAEPWSFVVVQDLKLLKRISDRAKSLMEKQQAAGDGQLARDSHAPHRAAGFLTPEFNIFYDASTLIAICAKVTGAFTAADCWLAAENLMLAATALGLATCPIGFAVSALNDPDVKSELSIGSDVSVIAPIIVGMAAATPPISPRREPVILSWKQ